MLSRNTSENPAVLSYYTMRRMVGVIAMMLPFALAGGAICAALFGPGQTLPHPLLERTISDYYFTSMRNLYVGGLCAIAGFLAGSRGYDLHDEIAGYVAGFCALGVAFFPSFNPKGGPYTDWELTAGFMHTAFAALMYLVLAYMCIFRFRKSSPGRHLTERKRRRNHVYQGAGLVMLACMFAIVVLTIRSVVERRHPSHWLFWCETVALVAFGVAWLTKGEGILRDRPHPDRRTAAHRRAAQQSSGGR